VSSVLLREQRAPREGRTLKVVRGLVFGMAVGAAGMALYEIADMASWHVLDALSAHSDAYVLAKDCFAGAVSGVGVGLLWPRGHVGFPLAGPVLAWVHVFRFGGTWRPLNQEGALVAIGGALVGWLVLRLIGARRHPTSGEALPSVVSEPGEGRADAGLVVSERKLLLRYVAIGLCVGFGLPLLLMVVRWTPALVIAMLPMMILSNTVPPLNSLGWGALGLNFLLWAGLGGFVGWIWEGISRGEPHSEDDGEFRGDTT